MPEIVKPTLLLDVGRARRNIARMAERARSANIQFRPHFKTHQSAAIGEWFRGEQVDAITVSSVSMARYFADNGWRDITIAFPVNLRELDAIDRLGQSITLGVLVDSVEAARALAQRSAAPLAVWIEVDAGYTRSGIPSNQTEVALSVAQVVAQSSHLRLAGLLTHSGNTYALHGREAVTAAYRATIEQLAVVRRVLQTHGFEGLALSIGDTPACSMVDDLGAVDEMRPGNFVFYDVMQMEIGACDAEEIAVAVACPIVGLYPERCEIALYGGAVHLAKDFLRRADGALDFGRVALMTQSGWGELLPNTYVRSLSQEHGIVKTDAATFAGLFSQLAIGDVVAVLPIHSCLTADIHRRLLTLEGDEIGMMERP